MLNKLKKGDKVNIVAPSSFIDEEDEFKKGIDILKTWGLKVISNNVLSNKYGYFAGDDQSRFEELEKAQNSKLIIFAKGGGTRPAFQKSRRDWISSQRDWISSQRDWN